MGYVVSVLDELAARLRDRNRSEAKKVHDLRVGAKRLRSLWRLTRNGSEHRLYRIRDGELRLLSRAVAPLRDRFVVRSLLRQIGAPKAEWIKLPESGTKPVPVTRALSTFRKNADALMALDLKGKPLTHALRNSLRQVKRERRRCLKRKASPARFHRWRKRAKNLMYQLEFARLAGVHVNARHMDALERLTKHLGKAHDFDVLCDYLWRNRGDSKLVALAEEQRRKFERKSLKDPFPF